MWELLLNEQCTDWHTVIFKLGWNSDKLFNWLSTFRLPLATFYSPHASPSFYYFYFSPFFFLEGREKFWLNCLSFMTLTLRPPFLRVTLDKLYIIAENAPNNAPKKKSNFHWLGDGWHVASIQSVRSGVGYCSKHAFKPLTDNNQSGLAVLPTNSN